MCQMCKFFWANGEITCPPFITRLFPVRFIDLLEEAPYSLSVRRARDYFDCCPDMILTQDFQVFWVDVYCSHLLGGCWIYEFKTITRGATQERDRSIIVFAQWFLKYLSKKLLLSNMRTAHMAFVIRCRNVEPGIIHNIKSPILINVQSLIKLLSAYLFSLISTFFCPFPSA